LGDLIDTACTINEINLPVLLKQSGFLQSDDAILRAPWRVAAARSMGVETAMFSSFPFCVRSYSREVLLNAHRLATQALRAGHGKFSIGMTLAMREMLATPGGRKNVRALVTKRKIFFSRPHAATIFSACSAIRASDSVRVAGSRQLAASDPHRPMARVPLLITENGVATNDDALRIEFIDGQLLPGGVV
jgi:beta-glucosidase